jgi:hypothetical protein
MVNLQKALSIIPIITVYNQRRQYPLRLSMSTESQQLKQQNNTYSQMETNKSEK